MAKTAKKAAAPAAQQEPPIERPPQPTRYKAGKDEMRGQPVLRDFDATGKAGGHHPPSDRALERTKSEDGP